MFLPQIEKYIPTEEDEKILQTLPKEVQEMLRNLDGLGL